MTTTQPSAPRYAQALFSLAEEGKQQAAVAASVASLAAALADAPVTKALANPLLTPAQRQSLAAAMAKSVKAPSSLAKTLGLLAANNRFAALPAVLASYQSLNDAAAGLTHVRLASAAPLTAAQRTKLSEMLQKHTASQGIRLDESVDPTLQGGFRAFFNGKVWDASLSGQLSRIATRLRNAVAKH